MTLRNIEGIGIYTMETRNDPCHPTRNSNCVHLFLYFSSRFFADQCAFTVVWSPYFCFKISDPQTIAVAREQF